MRRDREHDALASFRGLHQGTGCPEYRRQPHTRQELRIFMRGVDRVDDLSLISPKLNGVAFLHQMLGQCRSPGSGTDDPDVTHSWHAEKNTLSDVNREDPADSPRRCWAGRIIGSWFCSVNEQASSPVHQTAYSRCGGPS